jgi:hypothetical protein
VNCMGAFAYCGGLLAHSIYPSNSNNAKQRKKISMKEIWKMSEVFYDIPHMKDFMKRNKVEPLLIILVWDEEVER